MLLAIRPISSSEGEGDDYDFNQMPVVLSVGAAEFPVQLGSALLKPELSDVQISVVDDQKKPQLFHAHKLLLALASDVFKTMFFGSVPQENPVVVMDSNPAAFEAFLKSVYTGTTTIIEEDLFPLLYLGKKYLVGSLIKVVMNHLEKCITSENGQVVLAGQNFLEDAPPKFWQSVERHGEALLKSAEFPQLRSGTVQLLVQRELEAEESLVYEWVLAWAKAECARNHLPVDGETLRWSLEGIIQHVRFPAMTAEDFARGPAAEAVLTDGEKVQVLRWFAAGIPQSIFLDTPRIAPTSYVCERLSHRNTTWNISGSTEAICFSVSRAIAVTGFGPCSFYYGGYPVNYSIVAKLFLGSLVLATKSLTGTIGQLIEFGSDSSDFVDITFDKPVEINANKHYTASVVVTGPDTYYGHKGNASQPVPTKEGDVIFYFMQADTSEHTTVAQGMIPQIHFRI
ncbi:BTB/POZ domain-containing protein 3-like protein [Aphelenchoides avenae]|nr:BTB/POZ domain-containing protein 3-like protein [Aphelenchus avenae]